MALIKTLQRMDGTVLRTYKNKLNGQITHSLRTDIPGPNGTSMGIGIKLVKCDEVGNPYKMIDAAKNRYDVYEKAADGSTTLKTKINSLSFQILFLTKFVKIFFKPDKKSPCSLNKAKALIN